MLKTRNVDIFYLYAVIGTEDFIRTPSVGILKRFSREKYSNYLLDKTSLLSRSDANQFISLMNSYRLLF